MDHRHGPASGVKTGGAIGVRNAVHGVTFKLTAECVPERD